VTVRKAHDFAKWNDCPPINDYLHDITIIAI
jgi:hypothetical protein